MNGDPTRTRETTESEASSDVPSFGRRLRSLAELGEVADWCEPPQEAPSPRQSLDDVIASLATFERDLEAAAARDVETRREAEKSLEKRDRLVKRSEAAAEAKDRGRALSERAERLTREAFTPDAKDRATALLDELRRAIETAEAELARLKAEVERIDLDPGVQRLLAERERSAEATRVEAERANRLARFGRGLDAARARLAERDYDGAETASRELIAEFPDEPAPRALFAEVQSRLLARRLLAARSLLWDIRRSLRARPREVLDRIEALDLAGLDDELASGLFGEWLKAGRGLGIPSLLRCAPVLHQGALLMPLADDPVSLEVVSTIGGCGLRRGQVVVASSLRGLRPASERR